MTLNYKASRLVTHNQCTIVQYLFNICLFMFLFLEDAALTTQPSSYLLIYLKTTKKVY